MAGENQDGLETVPTEVVANPSPPSDSTGISPKDLLEAEKARQQLRELEIRQVADLIPLFRQMIEGVIKRLEGVIAQTDKVLAQALTLHELLMKDAETQFEVTKVFQSVLVVLQEVNQAGTLSATTEKPK